MYKKHSIEERLLAVKKCLRGQAPKYVGRKMGIEPHYVSEWLERYKKDGLSGIQKHPLKRADFAEKCKIICTAEKFVVPLHPFSNI